MDPAGPGAAGSGPSPASAVVAADPSTIVVVDAKRVVTLADVHPDSLGAGLEVETR